MKISFPLLLSLLTGTPLVPAAAYITPRGTPLQLQTLLDLNQEKIESLKDIARSITCDEAVVPSNDIFFLRYLLEETYEDEDEDERIEAFKSNIHWRNNEGKHIVSNAQSAIRAEPIDPICVWNKSIQQGAPHADRILEYLTPEMIAITSVPSSGDLVYCVRAGKIDSKALMSSVSIKEMHDFLLYTKEVNAQVADIRSAETGKLVKVIMGNDMSGAKLVGGTSADFQSALNSSLKQAKVLYPSLIEQMLLLNLPHWLGASVKMVMPMFPPSVRGKVRCESGPLKNVCLTKIMEDGAERDEFINQMYALGL